jgi:predicted RNase H-like HicB family nuclease
VADEARPGAERVDGASRFMESTTMKAELTAIIEEAPEGGYWAICAEVPGANGQGETIEEARKSLRDAIRLIFEDRLADMKRGLPEDAIQEVIAI